MNLPRRWHSPQVPHPHAIPGFSPVSAGLLRWLARGIGAFSLVAFAGLALREGIPASVLEEDWETPAQLALLVIVTIGYALAWRWEGLGSAVLIVGGVVLGVFASIAYEPDVALLGALAFVVPGLLFALHWQWHAGGFRLGGMLASVTLVLVAGGYASAQVYDHYAGPTHPESAVELLPVDLVEWAWSGGVTANGFIVVAELADEAAAASLSVAPESTFANPVTVAGHLAGETDRPAWRFDVTGLEPGQRYHYAVTIDGRRDAGRQGAVTTFPEGVASFTLAVGACIRTGSDGQVFDRIREADPLFMLVTGDFTYENLTSSDPDDFFDSYIENLTSPAQESLYLEAPINYGWDDHDYGGDGANALASSREAVREAYASYVPHYPLPDSDGAIYHAFTVGRVRFIVTDSRSEQLPETEPGGPTMLGAQQLEWLKAELLAAHDPYALTIWVNGVPWIAEPTPGADHWGGFPAEREEIANFIAANGLDRLAMISGDAHMVAIDDGTNTNYATVPGKAGKSFPLLHAAALDRLGSIKGGPYSEGAIAGGGQFALMQVEDDGATIRVTWSARNWKGEELLHYEFTP